MGAWGEGVFENDAAADWSYDLEESEDLSVIEQTLDRVVESEDEYLDSGIACEALAACDVMARLRGYVGAENETIETWVESHSHLTTEHLVPIACKAIDRILGPDSELNELWEESEYFESWKASVETLRTFLANS